MFKSIFDSMFRSKTLQTIFLFYSRKCMVPTEAKYPDVSLLLKRSINTSNARIPRDKDNQPIPTNTVTANTKLHPSSNLGITKDEVDLKVIITFQWKKLFSLSKLSWKCHFSWFCFLGWSLHCWGSKHFDRNGSKWVDQEFHGSCPGGFGLYWPSLPEFHRERIVVPGAK